MRHSTSRLSPHGRKTRDGLANHSVQDGRLTILKAPSRAAKHHLRILIAARVRRRDQGLPRSQDGGSSRPLRNQTSTSDGPYTDLSNNPQRIQRPVLHSQHLHVQTSRLQTCAYGDVASCIPRCYRSNERLFSQLPDP